jgi:hypothetical protein
MRRGFKVAFFWLVFVLLAIRAVRAQTGAILNVSSDPLQEDLTAPAFSIHNAGFHWTITPKAHYTVAGRVLSFHVYNSGWQSSLSPVDLALGWGVLADRSVDRWISWSQSGRWYYYHWAANAPYMPEVIGSHSSNVHIIPGNDRVRKVLPLIHKDDLVILEGMLVNVDGTNGSQSFGWHTSLSRTDTGDGACEVLYVQRVLLNGAELFQDNLMAHQETESLRK